MVVFSLANRETLEHLVRPARSTASHKAWMRLMRSHLEKLSLPDGVVGPIFNDEYGDVYSLMYAVKGDGVGHADLSDAAENIKRSLLKVPMVKKVDLIGKQAKRVYVEFSTERLATLGITPLAIAESLRSQNVVQSAGCIDTRGDRVMVRVGGQFASDDDIRKRKVTVSQILAHYRRAYTPAEGSPLINAGDPADGRGSYIGAVGAGKSPPQDHFGR